MTTAPAPRTRIPRWVFWLAGAVALALVTCAALGAFALWQLRDFDPLGSTLVNDLPAEKVALATGLALPPSTRDLHSHYESFQDYHIHARFTIDPVDLPALLASSQIPQPLSSEIIPPAIVDEIEQEWWQPQSATQFQAGEAQIILASGYPDYQAILVDQSDPEAYIVYIVAFDT